MSPLGVGVFGGWTSLGTGCTARDWARYVSQTRAAFGPIRSRRFRKNGGKPFVTSHLVSQGMPSTPVDKLAQEYERVMRVTVEGLELEPAVCMHKGSELLSQLRDQVVMLSELSDLIPACKIEEADVGVPGQTDSEMDEKLRRILRHHQCVFLGAAILRLYQLVEWFVT